MRRALPILALAALLAGCRQTSSTTEVRDDGSFTRSVKLMASDVTPDSTLKMPDVFVLPKAPEWKVNETPPTIQGGTTIEANGTFRFGQDITDIGLKQKGKVVLVNSVQVKEVTPGVYEYREVFTWKGERNKQDDGGAKIRERLDLILGPDSKIPAEKREQMVTVADRLLTQMLFGPPEPYLTVAIASPEFFFRKIRGVMGPKLLAAAERIFGDAMSPDERKQFVAKLLDPELATAQAQASAPSQPSGSEEEASDEQPTTLTMVVKMPGTLTETNGLIDPITGEVYWTMFSDAAQRSHVEIYARSKK